MRKYRKPLGRSIAFGCVLFTGILCIALSVLNYYNQRNALFLRYQSYITDILRYVDSQIDDEDLKHCIETTEESETYRKTLLFMDDIMNNFSIHYLYVIKPLNLNETGNVLSVMCAENAYNRYVDNEDNLYLGWISDDEYDVDTVRQLFSIMEQNDIVFFIEKTGWSTDYTGAVPLRDTSSEAYAILAVDVDITTLYSELRSRAIQNAAVILILGVLYTTIFLTWTKRNITKPVLLLEKGVVDYAGRSHGQRDVEALKFEAPDIQTENEVESLSRAITQMTEDMQEYVSQIISAEERTRDMKELADAMSELAVLDTLTGVRNKTAFSQEEENLEKAIAADREYPFGMAMIDLNYLKRINDTYGHEKGDEAIRTISGIIQSVFENSPVFRVGGDEFIVVLREQDYQNISELQNRFLSMTAGGSETEPWHHVSAAIGIALYDPAVDQTVEDVLKRADQAMYSMKKEMKACRSK